jgi:hypothetical protein
MVKVATKTVSLADAERTAENYISIATDKTHLESALRFVRLMVRHFKASRDVIASADNLATLILIRNCQLIGSAIS